ncbi:hypothetical protein V8C86DRAFT_1808883 [Haematococcus lacustris]
MQLAMRSRGASGPAIARPCSIQKLNVRVAASSGSSLPLVGLTCLAAGLLVSPAWAAGVSFKGLSNNAEVSSPVHLEFAVEGMSVKPAAEGVQPNSGHFHVLLDTGATAAGEVLPFDATHLHYGKGQMSADVPLAPGTHQLTLQFANALHESYGPDLASTVTVTVK